MAEKKPTANELFKRRLQREGRLDSFRARSKDLQSDGLDAFSAYRKGKEEFGYLGGEGEAMAYKDHVAALAARLGPRKPSGTDWLHKKADTEEEFAKTVSSLPDKASFATEIDWIRAHPAMVRIYRQDDKSKDVKLTIADVMEAPCGPAPSKSAVYSLQHWANHVMEFHKQMLSEHKKRQEDAKAEESVERDMGMDEVRKLLGEME